jgi:hypothetical protein
MGWKDVFNYSKAVAGNHGLEAAANPVREDDDLPLSGRVGGMLTLQMTPFIRASTGGSLLTIPALPTALIKAISRVKLNLDGKLYRYYLETGDSDGGQEVFLQIYEDSAGQVAELLYCTRLIRMIPETEDDQNAFTGSLGAGLGDKNFTVWKEQLANSGFSEAVLNNIFGAETSFEYMRDTSRSTDGFVAPFKGSESRVDYPNGEHGLKQELYYMPYVRKTSGGMDEYLLIATEIIEDQDGDASKRAIHVDFMIGIPLEKERVTVQ